MTDKLKHNVIALTMLQMGNYLVPVAILPYLTRVLGVDGFGRIGFATAFTMYFVLLVEWGFNLSSTRDVSVLRGDKQARSVVFWETIAARLMLLLVSVLALLILVYVVPKLGEKSTLLWLGMLQVLATSLSTAFFYQGIEKMGWMAMVNLSIRLLSIPLIFLMVSSPDDVIVAFAIQTGCFLLASLTNLIMLSKARYIGWTCPSLAGICLRIRHGFSLFVSSAGTSLYNNTNAVVLGFVASEMAVGYFVAGFTLVKAVVGLTGPFAQAVFPRVSHILASEPAAALPFIKKMVLLQVMLGACLSVGLWVFIPWGVTWFYGEAFQDSTQVVAWLSLLPFLICIASALGMQTLLPLGHNKWYVSVLTLSGLLNCLILLPLGYVWGAEGGAVAVLFTELVIMLGMLIGVKKLEPNVWRAIVLRP